MNNRIFEIVNDDELKQQYQQLIKAVNNFNKNKTKRLTICPTMAGSENAEIMIVGRAINGWCSIKQVCKDSTKSIDEQALEMVNRCSKCNLDWVVGENYYNKCQENNCPYAIKQKNEDKREKKSAFWRFAKLIVKNYFEDINKEFIEGEWQKEIIWTNLYKASYEDGGNPKGFYEAQVSMCDHILKREIELYQPQIIFFVTEKNHRGNNKEIDFSWFVEKDFSNTYKLIREFDADDDEYGCKVYVTKRPEYRKIEEVYNEKKSLN